MSNSVVFVALSLAIWTVGISASESFTIDLEENEESYLHERVLNAKMELWSRGAYSYNVHSGQELDLEEEVAMLERASNWSPIKLGPVRKVRRDYILQDEKCIEIDCPFSTGMNLLAKLRGGAMIDQGRTTVTEETYRDRLNKKLNQLGLKYGSEFREAIEKNEKEHAEDCRLSCESFYCAPESSSSVNNWDASIDINGTAFSSYFFGATPPEDFSEEFGFPLDLIKVTQGEPLFSSQEAAQVIETAQGEGVDNNEYESGKYKLGGDWLTNLPQTLEWFNKRLETTFFPLLSNLFPEIVSSPSVLRAHSVSLLKYNASHPRTDVHIDNGILAMTLAMTPKNDYVGGGTFFEHMGNDNVLPMDVGHGTFRPGSVRHGGHRVTEGTRYILGAFLLIDDRVVSDFGLHISAVRVSTPYPYTNITMTVLEQGTRSSVEK